MEILKISIAITVIVLVVVLALYPTSEDDDFERYINDID
jgi:uncharacterized protein involved in outer membrane biogenesis